MDCHLLGIRHHGPGSSKSVRAALKTLAGAADDARESVRTLRLAEPMAQPELFENRATMIVAPWAATALNKAFRKVWNETLPA